MPRTILVLTQPLSNSPCLFDGLFDTEDLSTNVKILDERLYIVPSIYRDDIKSLDDLITRSIANGDRAEFAWSFSRLIELIRKNGIPMDSQAILTSDLVIPPADVTFDEAREIFVSKGLVPC